MKKVILLVGIFAFLIFSTNVYADAFVYPSFAGLGLGELETEGMVRYEIGESYSEAYAYAEDDNDTDVDFGDVYAEAGVEDAIAEAGVGLPNGVTPTSNGEVQSPYMYEETGARANGITNTSGYAEAEASLMGYLYVDGEGSITLSAEYLLQQLIALDGPGDYGYAFSEAGIWAGEVENGIEPDFIALNNDNGIYYEEKAYLENELFGPDFGEWEENDLLAIILPVDGEMVYAIGGWVYNEAEAHSSRTAVPEPSTLILLGLGLTGLVGLGRKKNKKI